MSDERFLSRITLRHDAPVAALRSVLLPEGDDRRMMVGHQLIWTLFTDSPERRRDFLWRDAGDGRFYTLSARPPRDAHGIFDIDEPKPFLPVLGGGDRLRFMLRANATVARKVDGDGRGKPQDVVMQALHGIPSGRERAGARALAVRQSGGAWLQRQGERLGFSVPGVDSHTVGISHRVLRVDHAGSRMTIGIIDYDGELVVQDPGVFVAALCGGFGRAKAFGCGLMLVRRA